MKECPKANYQLAGRKSQKGYFYRIEKCNKCNEKCERLALPTKEEEREFNG